MASTIRCIIATINFLAISGISELTVAATESEPHAIDLHLAEIPSADLIKVVARIGEPKALTIETGQTPRSIIESRCGIVDPTYVALLLDHNRNSSHTITPADLDQPLSGDTIIFPACIRSETEPHEVLATQTISDIYEAKGIPFDARAVQNTLYKQKPFNPRNIESIKELENSNSLTAILKSNRGFIATEYARQFIHENPNVNPSNIKIGDTIRVAAQNQTSTIPIRSDLAFDEAMDALKETISLEQIDQAKAASLVEDQVLSSDECTGTLDIEHWPIPIDQLKAALAINEKLRPKAGQYHPTTVLVLDTGYDPIMPQRAIPSSSLGLMTNANGTASILKYDGVNTATGENHANPPLILKNRFHGSEVAATILGGRFLEGSRSSLPMPRLVFASIAQEAGGTAYLDISAINRAYNLAIESNIRIINASIAANARLEEFVTGLKQGGGQVLVIAAAGNTNPPYQEFNGKDQPWPGSLGGNPQNVTPGLVVSVGAHDPNGHILGFSRSGKEQVDLLAPGCRIPTFSYDADTSTLLEKELSGTSYAAPIVSFIAALLSAETLKPAAIKDRLIVSVDMDSNLVQHVYSGGVLNIRKALSIHRDTVEFIKRDSNGEIIRDASGKPTLQNLYGTLLTGNRPILICEDNIHQRDIRKLSVTSGSTGKYIRGWRTPKMKKQSTAIDRIEKCPAGEGLSGGMIFRDDDGRETTVPLADIVDFVAREP